MAKYLFGDIVKEVKEKVDRNNNPYEYFIAGEHMDTDELHLLRRGTFKGSDVGPAFIRLFKPGQVLYGSRRTYLRKVAVADFEGVTANTTFVFESKDESVLLQKLLPFIMQSDRFVKHSINRSKGSTNPYVLFSDLADYEVNLPDIEKQHILAEILWSIDTLKMAYKKMIAATDELVKSQFMEMFGLNKSNNLEILTCTLDSVCTKITDGSHNPPKGINDSDYYMLSSKNIIDGSITLDNPRFLSEEEWGVENKRTQISAGDVLLTIVGTIGRCAVVPKEHPNITLQRSVCVLKPKKDMINSYFLFYQLKCMQSYIDGLAQGAAQRGIYLTQVGKLNVVVPDLVQQEAFVEFLQLCDKSKFELEQALTELEATYKRLIADNLG